MGLAALALGLSLALLETSGAAFVLAADTPPVAASPLRACVDELLTTVAREERVKVVERVSEVFLLPGDVRVHAVSFPRAECLGFLAVGAKYTQDIELNVQSPDGLTLATADGPTTTPYAFYCGQAGEHAFVTLRMLDGQGEVAFMSLAHFELDARNQARLARCPSVGTPRPGAVDLGDEPQARSIAEELERVNSSLGALGYQSQRMASYGTIGPQQHEARSLQLDPAHCYALAAVGSRDIVDLDLRVFGPSISLRPLAEDTTRKRTGIVKLCAEQTGSYVLDVAVFQGGGAYAVQLYELDEPSARPPGVSGDSRISYAETHRRLRDVGFTPDIVSSGVVRDDAGLTLAFDLKPGRCYAFAAVGTHGLQPGKLMLTLIDQKQNVVGLDARNGRDPLAFRCPKAAEQVRAVVRSREARGAARFLMLFAQDQPQNAKATP